MRLAFTHTHYKGHPYTKHCICCLPLHIYWIYYYYFSFSLLLISPLGIFFFLLQSMQSIVINCIFLILFVIVLLLWGVVIDKIKVVVVVIKFDHIRVGKTICCKLGGQRNFWMCFSLRHFGQLCILSIPDAIKRI